MIENNIQYHTIPLKSYPQKEQLGLILKISVNAGNPLISHEPMMNLIPLQDPQQSTIKSGSNPLISPGHGLWFHAPLWHHWHSATWQDDWPDRPDAAKSGFNK